MSLAPTRQITLTEYLPSDEALTSDQVSSILAVAGTALEIRPRIGRAEVGLRSLGYVGTIVIPGLEIVIRPKVPIVNLLYLLEAAGQPIELDPAAAHLADRGEITAVMATLFAEAVDRATARGLRRSYVVRQESVVALRGRLDIAGQMRRTGLMTPVECRFDEYSADNAENRVLRCALARVERLGRVPQRTRHRIARLHQRLDGVAEVAVRPDEIDRICGRPFRRPSPSWANRRSGWTEPRGFASSQICSSARRPRHGRTSPTPSTS